MPKDFPQVDLHSHPIPDLDDGPSTFEESLALLERAWREGTRRLVATPHCYHPQFELGPQRIRQAFTAWKLALEDYGRQHPESFLHQLEVLAGAENMFGSELLDAASVGEAMTLAEGPWLLVELPSYLPPVSARAGLSRLESMGYRPLLAHAERYPELVKHRDRLWALERVGVALQINASSLLRRDRVGRRAHRLLKSGLVLAVASDAHHAERRPPDLTAVRLELERRHGRQRARFWLGGGPAAILAGEEHPVAPPPPDRAGWRKLFGLG